MDCVAWLVAVCSLRAKMFKQFGWMQGPLALGCVAVLDGLCGLARPAVLVAGCRPCAEIPTGCGYGLNGL